MNPPLDGKWALITGASKGVGKGIALELAAAGANIVVNFNSDEQGAAATAAAVRQLGREARSIQASVADPSQIQRMFDALDSPLDILVNDAGVQTWKPLLDLAVEDWDRVHHTNLRGTFLCTQHAAARMKDSGGGRIINIGSGSNKVPFPKLVDYTASKGGLEMLTRVSAIELGRYGITVNCVAPGAIEIERTNEENPDYRGTWGGITPLGRVGLPADVGKAVVFFASPLADFVTGQTLWVDGGLFTHPQWPYPAD
jgi:NAD(P)-dependent dehydrogenase (short-subunit alcohol dehydrogenase family)